MALDVEAAVKDCKVRWNNIHRLQRVYGGHRPVQPTAVFKDNGELTKGPSEVSDRWFQHFKKVLNIQSTYVTRFWKISPNVTFDNSNIYSKNKEKELSINIEMITIYSLYFELPKTT